MARLIAAEELWEAWERVESNEGCAGCDAVRVDQFAHRAAREIESLADQAANGTYKAFPLLRIVVEKKAGTGKTRTLLVPTVRDRVIQTAIARQLSRSFEEEFLECSYGYRPGRSVDRAIARIRKLHELGYVYVVDADIETFFDRIDHSLLLSRLERQGVGEGVMGLLRQWIGAAVWNGHRIYRLRVGVPQGSPISPLLANFFLEDFDAELEKSGKRLVRYADDFLVLAKTEQEAQQAMSATETALEQAHLDLNKEKTRIVDFARGFEFLGALFLGSKIWIPWKHQPREGRIVAMAGPMPLALRTRWMFGGPRRTVLEEAFRKAGGVGQLALAEKPAKSEEGGTADMAFLYLSEQGSVLRKAGDRLLVEKEDEVLLDLPYHKLETVLLFGNIQVTTQAMAELLEKGVGLSLFSRQGLYRGQLTPPRGGNVEVRWKQFEACQDPQRSLGIAKTVVKAKLRNGLAVLDWCRERNPVGEGWDGKRDSIAAGVGAVDGAADLASLNGVEGAGAKAYFDCLMEFNKSGMTWPGRQKHPAKDPLNSLLSFTYMLLMHELSALIEAVGLDPYFGFLHQMDYGRPSLALDLIEPLRHPLADRLVLLTVNRNIIDENDFQSTGEHQALYLSPKALKRYVTEYEQWMLTRPSPTAPRRRDSLRNEVEALAKALRDGSAYSAYEFSPEVPCST